MWERILIPMLKQIIGQATPEIRNLLVGFLDDLQDRAKATPNPFDDLLVMVIRGLIDL